VEGRVVIDLIEGRQAPDLDRWLTKRSREWIDGVTVTVCDLHEPFRAALARHLPDATAVADPMLLLLSRADWEGIGRREEAVAGITEHSPDSITEIPHP
jgi:transposase